MVKRGKRKRQQRKSLALLAAKNTKPAPVQIVYILFTQQLSTKIELIAMILAALSLIVEIIQLFK